MSNYYTCFKFKDYEPKNLHCTHKFLGKQPIETINNIVLIIDEYFENNIIQSFSPNFNEEDFFGPDKKIRVLKTSLASHNFILDLRNKLDKFKEDNHIIYNPHVSTQDLNLVNLPFYSYALIKDGKVYKEWILK